MNRKEVMKVNSSKRKTVIYHGSIWGGLGLLMIYPILWTIASSLKPESEIFRNAASLIPSEIRWDNYLKGWEASVI